MMGRLKLFYIISDIDKALPFEWISINLREMCDLKFILIGKEKPALSIFLDNNNIPYTIVSDAEFPRLHQKVLKMARIFNTEKPDIIHTHLWRANLICQPLAWLLGIRKRIYTRHHATIHYNEFPSGRKWDILINSVVTKIVAISNNVKEILVERDKTNPTKIVTIPHGFDLEYFRSVSVERIEIVKKKHNIPSDAWPIVGVISRYLKWKGIHFTIDAFKQLKKRYPNAHLVLSNTQGGYSDEIKEKLKEIDTRSFSEIFYEEDVAALYRIFTLYVHVPTDPHVEAFGQTYIEALAAGVPSIFTLSGIAREFIVHEHNALVVDYESSMAIFQSMLKLLENKELQEVVIRNGEASVNSFALEQMIVALKELYNN
jgi:glycosyltransferase involved in cell wall biosynthesis